MGKAIGRAQKKPMATIINGAVRKTDLNYYLFDPDVSEIRRAQGVGYSFLRGVNQCLDIETNLLPVPL